jgi:YggT family protein
LENVIVGIDILCRLWGFAVVVRAVLSWFNLRPDNPVVRFLDEVTDPILAPLRRVIPTAGGIDFAPMVAILILWWGVPMLLQLWANSLD